MDKGLLINADVIISVAEVPLIGVKLNAAIASIETMRKYGVMTDWIDVSKEHQSKEDKLTRSFLSDSEVLINSFYGSASLNHNSCQTRKYGHFYVTNHRILLIRKEPFENLAEICYDQIENCCEKDGYLNLQLKGGESFQIYSSEANLMKAIIRNELKQCNSGNLLEREVLT